MGVFLYYLPGLSKPQICAETLRLRPSLALPLRDELREPALVERGLIVHAVHAGGPDGSSGTILAPRPPGGRELKQPVGYYPARQTWEPLDDGAVWLGRDREQPPGPDDVAREIQITGYAHELADGRVWNCPTVRHPGASVNLPQSWGVDDDGRFTERILPPYQWAWDATAWAWDVFAGNRDCSTAEAWDFCVRMLGLNYRLGAAEVSRLGLLTSENFKRVFHAAIDGELVQQALDDELKKKAHPPDSGHSPPGGPGDSPDTPRAAESCTSPR